MFRAGEARGLWEGSGPGERRAEWPQPLPPVPRLQRAFQKLRAQGRLLARARTTGLVGSWSGWISRTEGRPEQHPCIVSTENQGEGKQATHVSKAERAEVPAATFPHRLI